MNAARYSFVVLALLWAPVCVRAEMPPQDRKSAPTILTGVVEAIDETWDLETDYYQVSVRVEQVERGGGIQAGQVYVVSCFRWSRALPGKTGAAGHTSIPDVGDKIRLFAWGNCGNYPNWYDVLEPSNRPWWARWSDSRKIRVGLGITGVALLGWATWRFRKRMRVKSAQQGRT